MGIISVADIYYYPLKSAQAVHLDKAEIVKTGIRNDRRAILVHAEGIEAGKAITQRTPNCAKLALVGAHIDEAANSFIFTLPDGKSTNVQLNTGNNHALDQLDVINVWNNAVKGIDGGDIVAGMFSAYLDIPCRLKLYPSQAPRKISKEYSQYARDEDEITYVDKFPLLFTSTTSLREVNEVAPLLAGHKKPFMMEAYRPNIVFDGAPAFAEDHMYNVRIGEAEFEFRRPADRCSVTNINQMTGEVYDPMGLARLASLRFGKGADVKGAVFGALASPSKLGTIKVGDQVEILSWKPLHEALHSAKMQAAGNIYEMGPPPPAQN